MPEGCFCEKPGENNPTEEKKLEEIRETLRQISKAHVESNKLREQMLKSLTPEMMQAVTGLPPVKSLDPSKITSEIQANTEIGRMIGKSMDVVLVLKCLRSQIDLLIDTFERHSASLDSKAKEIK